MSWSLRIIVDDPGVMPDADTLAEMILAGEGQIEGVTVDPYTGSQFESAEHRAQLLWAVHAAVGILPTVIRLGDACSISLAGHANAGNAPCEGYANGMVTVQVIQRPIPPPPE